jgi:hypothetical protein
MEAVKDELDSWNTKFFDLLTDEQTKYVALRIHKTCKAIVDAKARNLTPEQFIDEFFHANNDNRRK